MYKGNLKRKRPFKKGRKKSKGSVMTYRSMFSKVWRDLKHLRSLIGNVEYKYLDITFSGAISTTANLQLLNGLFLGDTATSRSGQSIKITSEFLRCYITMNAAATMTQVRVILFIDTQPNAAAPTGANLLTTPSDVLSALTIGYGSRFVVMRDKIFRLDTNKLNVEYKTFMKQEFHVKYNVGNAGDITDITDNSLYLLMLSDQATNTPTVKFWNRIRYLDN